MGAGCTDMSNRASFLGITQDETCVSWTQLVDLREKYNVVWEMLDACGKAEGEKYGIEGKAQETADLPSVEGFFRLELSAVKGGDGVYVLTPVEVKFICTGGSFYSRINDPAYSYFTSEVPYSVILKDACNNCSVFGLESYVPAEKEVTCPRTGVLSLYEGWYALDIGSCSPGCGGMLVWADNLEIFYDQMEFFDLVKQGSTADDCHEIVESCCGLFTNAHYEEVEPGIMVLRFLDIYVDGAGSPTLEGNLSTLIRATDVQDIQDRIYSDLDDIKLNQREPYCDQCGFAIDNGNGVPGKTGCSTSTHGYSVRCTSHWYWENLSILNYVTGIGATKYADCKDCDEENFTGVICACPWERLAGILEFVAEYGCVTGCSTKCPGEMNGWIEVDFINVEGYAYSCAAFQSGGVTYMGQTAHMSASVTGCTPSSGNFTCHWERFYSTPSPSISSTGFDCHSPTTDDSQKTDNCKCPSGPPGSVGSASTDSFTNTDAVSQSSLTDFAIANATTTNSSYGKRCTIDCNYCNGLGYGGIGSIGIQSSNILTLGQAHYVSVTIKFTMKGDKVPATLKWVEKNYTQFGVLNSTTNKSAAINAAGSWTVSVNPTAAVGTYTYADTFSISVP